MVRRATLRFGVTGTYAPPANLKEHFRHSHIPVPTRFTELVSHLGQVWVAFEISSTSRTLFRINRPYLGPNLPVEPETFPFAFTIFRAILKTSLNVLSYCF